MNTVRSKAAWLKKAFVVLFVLVVFVFTTTIALAVDSTFPEGPVLTTVNTTRRNITSARLRTAVAGNVTQITLTGSSITQTWQGYYGNITGRVRLDNAANEALYTWNLPYPSGEIFATQVQVVNWTSTNLRCWELDSTNNYDADLTLTEYEGGSSAPVFAGLGLTAIDVDGVDETFTNHTPGSTNATGHSNFYVGNKLFNGSMTGGAVACPRTWLYNSSGTGGFWGAHYEDTAFEEVLIYGNIHGTAASLPIYTSIVRQYGAPGFDGKTWNFEMIVAENGHNGNTATTNYYFYVELE